MTLRLGILVVGIGCAWAGVGSVRADEPLGQYFEGLRARQMFTVAETEAQRRLSQEELEPATRAELTIELSKTYAAHAAVSAGDEQRELWTAAEQVVTDLLRAEPNSVYRGPLMAQRGLVPAARGAQLRWQAELFPLDQTTQDDAAVLLREALDRLRPLPDAIAIDLKQSQAIRRAADPNRQRPPPAQLYQLKRTVEFTIATAALDLAKVLPAGPDQTASLLEAEERFDELTRLARPDDVAWQSRVHLLDILRMQGQFNRLAGAVTALVKAEAPPPIADAATAVLVRRWLDDNRPDEALSVLETYRQEHGLDADELQALVVESLLVARRLAIAEADKDLASDLWTRAEAIDAKLHGPWKVRTRLLLDQEREADRFGPQLAADVRAAHWAWQNGNVDDAIAAYTRAAAAAHQRGETEMAVEFGLNIASAQVEVGRFTKAVRSLGNLLEAYPNHDKAAKADLLRAYALGRLFEQKPTDETKQMYRDSLVAHREKYASQPTVVEATWMLARLVDYEQDWGQAIVLLQQIPGGSPHFAAAIARLSAVFEQAINNADKTGMPTAEWEQQAIEVLTPIASAFPKDPALLTIEQADVARRLAWILLQHDPPDFTSADTLLQRVMTSGRRAASLPEDAIAAWASRVAAASQLRVISLAGQGRLADARELLDEMTAEDPQQLLEVLNGLTNVATDIGLEHRTGIGRMQLELAQKLKSELTTLPEDEQRSLDLALAQAFAAIGQWEDAANLYEQMLWNQARDVEVVGALAQLYEQCGTVSCLKQAVKQWRTLETMQKQGSIDWLQSRYHQASCSHRLGDNDVARKLVGVTRVLYPQLGSPTLKQQYEALAAEVPPPQK